MINLQEWKANNLAIDIRYAPALQFFKKRDALIEKFFITFPNINSQNISNITMHTELNPGISLNILPNRINLIFEQFKDCDLLNKNKELCTDILKMLDITSIQRFGMRINMIKIADPDISDTILNEFIINKFNDLELINSGYTLNFKNNENLYIRVALNKGVSQNIQIVMNQATQQVTQQPNFGIITDIDVSKESVDTDEISSLIDCALKEYEKCQLMIN